MGVPEAPPRLCQTKFARRVTLYMLTKRLTDDVGPPELELPDIHVMGKDSERKTVYE